MKRALATLAFATLLCARVGAQTAPHPAPPPPPILVLPHPPPPTNQTNTLIFNAMLAIARAAQTNPSAAQAAQYPYFQAIQKLNANDLVGAREAAVQALSIAGQAGEGPTPLATIAPFITSVPEPPHAPLFGLNAPSIDADAFLALARGSLRACAAANSPALPAAQIKYALAEKDAKAGNISAVRADAKAAIDLCAITH
jgi:hypothetical protein